MWHNHLKVAFRNFARHKLFTGINILGLAIGISAALVIFLIVQHEFSYEKDWKDGKRMYRVVSDIDFPGSRMNNSGVPIPLADAMRQEVTGLDGLTHFLTEYERDLLIPAEGGNPSKKFKREKNIVYADSSFFLVFPFQFLAGDAVSALKAPFSTVLTESRAKAYFGELTPAQIVGKTLSIDDTIQTTITAVVADLNTITDFSEFKMFVSRSTITETSLRDRWGWDQWGSINSASQLFVVLKPGTKPADVLAQVKVLREKYRQRGPENEASEKDDISHGLQPLADIHFNPTYGALGERQAHRPTLVGLLFVAGFLLLLGCINFVNLSTAQSSSRAKEIGIRKTLGSSRGQLIRQHLTETLVLTLLATLLSVALVPWLLYVFKSFIPPAVTFSSLNQPIVWLFMLALLLLVTLLAGIYPAFALTRFRPVSVLKNQTVNESGQSRKAWLRKTLTVTQFVVAQFLLIATLVVGKQIYYSINKDLGYKKEAIVSINTPYIYADKTDLRRISYLNELNTLPGVALSSLGSSAPASNSTNSNTLIYEEGEQKVEAMVENKAADTNYFRLYGMKLVAGRNLMACDTIREYVINETYAKMLGFKNPADAIGKMLKGNGIKPIVGVVADFHTKSTHTAIGPLAYSANRNRSFTIHLALPLDKDKADWKQTLAQAETIFQKYFPEEEFKYSYFDETVLSFYKAEQDISRLLKWATGLCLFISCLGLLGLVIFITNTRTKEIGVRKVLGASVSQIVALLSRDFLALIALAFLIAMPLAWWAMNRWLEDFVYRTQISWWIFASTAGIMLVTAAIVLGIRTVRAAMVNPVKSLRTE